MAHFWSKKFFFKKSSSITHHADFQVNLMSQSQENFQTEGQKDGTIDGKTRIHRTFQIQPGVQKIIKKKPKHCLSDPELLKEM